ncbi:hypothetical protein CLBKND_04868 [Methylorubrum aminovorans]
MSAHEFEDAQITLPDWIAEREWNTTFEPIRRVEKATATYGYATYNHPEDGPTKVPACLFDDGSLYTPSDWQTYIDVNDQEEVERQTWVDPSSGQRLLMFGGAPRKLAF